MGFTSALLVLLASGASHAEPARVTLETTDGRPVLVSEVLAQMGMQTYTNFGASAVTSGELRTDLCMTTCTLELPAGYHKLRFGAFNPMNANVPLDLTILPGDSTLRVRPFDGGKAVSGLLLAIVGGSALITGGTLALVQTEDRAPMAALAAAGAGATIGSVFLVNDARARLEP
jgi:hypothetical protein